MGGVRGPEWRGEAERDVARSRDTCRWAHVNVCVEVRTIGDVALDLEAIVVRLCSSRLGMMMHWCSLFAATT